MATGKCLGSGRRANCPVTALIKQVKFFSLRSLWHGRPIWARKNLVAVQRGLLPTKHLRRKRGANDKNYCEGRYVADVRRPHVAVPHSLEKRHGIG